MKNRELLVRAATDVPDGTDTHMPDGTDTHMPDGIDTHPPEPQLAGSRDAP